MARASRRRAPIPAPLTGLRRGGCQNLKFFEPYLWIVLVSWGLSLTDIGLLVSVEKVRPLPSRDPSAPARTLRPRGQAEWRGGR